MRHPRMAGPGRFDARDQSKLILGSWFTPLGSISLASAFSGPTSEVTLLLALRLFWWGKPETERLVWFQCWGLILYCQQRRLGKVGLRGSHMRYVLACPILENKYLKDILYENFSDTLFWLVNVGDVDLWKGRFIICSPLWISTIKPTHPECSPSRIQTNSIWKCSRWVNHDLRGEWGRGGWVYWLPENLLWIQESKLTLDESTNEPEGHHIDKQSQSRPRMGSDWSLGLHFAWLYTLWCHLGFSSLGWTCW